MTRTERATSPRAILKDRSESRSGMDKRTPKGGAGTHNWGSLMNERDYEDAALYDEEGEEEQAAGERPADAQDPIAETGSDRPHSPTASCGRDEEDVLPLGH